MSGDGLPSASRIIKWFILVAIYLGISAAIFPLFIVGIAMGLSAWAFAKDKVREKGTSDSFKGDNLFYRNGRQIDHTVFSIPVKPEWEENGIKAFSDQLQQGIQGEVKTRFPTLIRKYEESNDVDGEQLDVSVPVLIADRQYTETKGFLRIAYWSKRGSNVTHFVHNAIMGLTIVVHFFSYVRGKYAWYDVTDFIISSPITIWFWGIPWLMNKYSIVSSISRNLNNSYDLMDLQTFFQSSSTLMLDATKQVLKEEDLLTDELQMVINNYYGSVNQANINNSSGVNLSNIGNMMGNTFQRRRGSGTS